MNDVLIYVLALVLMFILLGFIKKFIFNQFIEVKEE